MHILALFLSSFFLSHLFLCLSRLLSLSRSHDLHNSLFSPVVSRCVFAGFCKSSFQEVNNLCVGFGIARCLRLWESVAHALCDTQLHSHGDCMSHATTHPVCYTANESHCQPRMIKIPDLACSGRWCFFNRAELNVVEVLHARCLPPVVAQVPHIFVHFHALSVFGGGSLSPWSFPIARSKA